MRAIRRIAAFVALMAPPLVLAALVWPHSTGTDEEQEDSEGVPFEQPVDDVHTVAVELDGDEYEITLRPDFSGACLDVNGPTGGSGMCGDLDSMRHPQGFTVNPVGDGSSTVFTSGLAEPEVGNVELLLDDEPVDTSAAVAELPGRPEKVFVVVGTVDQARVTGPGIPQFSIRLVDDAGEVLDEVDL